MQLSPHLAALILFSRTFLQKCSLSLREGRIMSYIGLRTLPSAVSHGPEGTHGPLPVPAEPLAAGRCLERDNHCPQCVSSKATRFFPVGSSEPVAAQMAAVTIISHQIKQKSWMWDGVLQGSGMGVRFEKDKKGWGKLYILRNCHQRIHLFSVKLEEKLTLILLSLLPERCCSHVG